MELRTFGRTARNHGTHELYFNRPVGRMKTNIMLDSRGLPGMPGFGRAPGDGGGYRLLFPLHIRTETLIASKEIALSTQSTLPHPCVMGRHRCPNRSYDRVRPKHAASEKRNIVQGPDRAGFAPHFWHGQALYHRSGRSTVWRLRGGPH